MKQLLVSFGCIRIEWDNSKRLQLVNILLFAGQSITLPTSKGSVAKFEHGLVQTLASKLDDNTWKSLENPNHTIELVKCHRYLQVLSTSSKWNCIGFADCNGSTSFAANINISCSFRIYPSIKFSGLSVNGIKINELRADQSNYNMIKLYGTLESSVPTGLYPIYQNSSVNSFFELSAEL